MINIKEETTKFKDDIKKGKVGERIFIEDFLDFLNIGFEDVSDKQAFQTEDTDFLSGIGSCEVKSNYRDNNELIIEEYTNINESLGRKSRGWYYKSTAKTLVFVSSKTRTMIILPFTDEFKEKYEEIKERYPLRRNRISERGKSKWQSAFRVIPLEALSGYYSIIQKK